MVCKEELSMKISLSTIDSLHILPGFNFEV